MVHDYSNVPAYAGEGGGGSPFDKIMLLDHNGQERWSARDLQRLMGYDEWRSFEETISRAKASVAASDLNPLDHFVGAHKVIKGGRWGQQQVSDYRLTRYACYMTALSADSRKPEVAVAKTYFAVKTREAETAETQPLDVSSPEGVVQLAELYLKTAKAALAAQKELEVAKPKAGKWDTFCDSDGLIDMGAAARAFYGVTGGLGRTKFMARLRDEDIHFLQIQNPRVPYQIHVNAGRAVIRIVQAPNGQWMEQTFLTSKGLDWLADRFGVGALPAA
ncbi:phage antirepressor KilAC domain-containing protein [Streptomyces sp. ICBB 8177]|uniref:phage antirepressor KilAC domain-containing protein n=1 Tax=Streptomyces sp. ICBB 8177 TaxID=563922 RepID=UPI000D67BAA6|nr:phage antirepressor KilAC domain-containing protein [Streptomyces sp. ICBB 8177]PWI45951.1 hypothetical protein CK485_02065 [Streptomyces sp. ICBB 8177]